MTNPSHVHSDLANSTVLAPDGSVVKLGSLWADGPAVIAWIRHFG